jgi:hypothetical protein
VRINPTNSASLPALEAQEIPPLTNQRVPRGEISSDWRNTTLPPLALGQEIDAVVLEVLSDGRILVDLGAAAVEAESPSDLTAGQHLRLRVEQLQPQLVLYITEIEPTIEVEGARLLRAHLPAHADAGELLEQLIARLEIESATEPVSPTLAKLRESIARLLPDGAPPAPEQLRNLFQNGGIYYEPKLFHAARHEAQALRQIADGDLKGLLLSAMKEAEAGAHSADFKSAIGAQLNNLETQQAVNLLAQLDGGAFQFQIPFFSGTRFSTAALSVERDGRGAADRQDKSTAGYNLLFLLDLENFGRTRIDAHVSERELKVIFYVDRESSIALLREEIPSFRQTLVAMGYREVLLAAKTLKEIPEEKRQKFDAIAVGAPPSIHLLDVKA